MIGAPIAAKVKPKATALTAEAVRRARINFSKYKSKGEIFCLGQSDILLAHAKATNDAMRKLL